MPKTNAADRRSKQPLEKRVSCTVWNGEEWCVVAGKLVPRPGRPAKTAPLLLYVAEKLPWDSLNPVYLHLRENHGRALGVYMAHDSMGVARYGGRGDIFSRLKSHEKKYAKELVYYSFYVIRDKKHERELETAILRAAGPQMILNQRKVRDGIDPGSVHDYEPGTRFFERQGKGGSRRRPARTFLRD